MSTKSCCTPYICGLCEKLAPIYSLDETLDILAAGIAEAADAKACSIRLLDRKKMTLEIVAAHGLGHTYLEKGPVPLDQHPVDGRVLAGEAAAAYDITAEPHLLYVEEAVREGIHSVLSVPLSVRDRTIGVVRIFTGEPHAFSAEEIEFIRGLASFGGILADRAQIWGQMRILIDVARSMTSSLSLEEVLNRVVEKAAEVFGFFAASIRLLDAEMKQLHIQATYGLSRDYLEKGTIEVAKSPIDLECLADAIVTINDVSKDGRLQYPEAIAREGIGALISLPLRARGKVLGVLRVYNSRPYEFRDYEIDFLAALASQGAVAIENARLFEHIQNEYEELTRDVWKWFDWGKNFPKL
jgi:signal transduction protein with GAF and PtsI domain